MIWIVSAASARTSSDRLTAVTFPMGEGFLRSSVYPS